MKLPWLPVMAGTMIAALGAVGLIRGAGPPGSSGTPRGGGRIVVTNPYIRAPVPLSRTAAAYFTLYNTTGTDDKLLRVRTGIGAIAELHILNSDGSLSVAGEGVVIPAHSKLVLAAGESHVMIENVYGTLDPGQTAHLELDFQNARPIDVTAPVIDVTDPIPMGTIEPRHPVK